MFVIILDNYVLYRNNRGTRLGGGVTIYVSAHFISVPAVPKVTPSLFEGIFLKIKLSENKHLTISSICRPPVRPDSSECIVFTLSSF